MAELRFLMFLLSASALFFLPNGPLVLAVGVSIISIYVMLSLKRCGHVSPHKALRSLTRFLPFIFFVVVCNGLLDSWVEAGWIGFKLLVVCVMTLTYLTIVSKFKIAYMIANLLRPLRRFGLTFDDTYLLIVVALMLIPILRRTLSEIRDACYGKGLRWNLRTAKVVLLCSGRQILERVEQIDQAITAKGK